MDVLERDRVRLEPSDRALGEDGLTEGYRQSAVIHACGSP